MGVTGRGLVRSIFSNSSRSITTHHTTHRVKRNNCEAWEKRRWRTSVRSYLLCGDPDQMLFTSVLADDQDTAASVRRRRRSFEEEDTVTQPTPGPAEKVTSTHEYEGLTSRHSHQNDLHSEFLDEDVAATIIQSIFRGFLVRRLWANETESVKNELFNGLESPNKESLATSIDVQSGSSINVVSFQEECPSVCTKKPKSSIFIQKEDWDDSTVDSNVSKMRIQNRLEAMTRREKALAYAFSQQLRICPKKKQTIYDDSTEESNTGWTWLERWMATRQPEGLSIMSSRISQQLNELTGSMKTKQIAPKTFLDVSFEGKESCGSNEVPEQCDGSLKHKHKSSGNRLKAPINISRRKIVPAAHYHNDHAKLNKRDGPRRGEMDKRQKMKQSGSTDDSDDVCQSSADHSNNGFSRLKSEAASD